MTDKSEIKKDIDRLKQTSSDNAIGFLYKHPDTGVCYDQFKREVDPSEYGLTIHYGYTQAPFVVEREKAETEDWHIVESVSVDLETDYYDDLVEVSEWCVNPWVDNSDDRTVITE